MPASKKKKTESTNLEERVAKLEAKINILYNVLKETREMLSENNEITKKIKNRMGL